MRERFSVTERMAAAFRACAVLGEELGIKPARALVIHLRPEDWIKDERTGLLVPDPRSMKPLAELDREVLRVRDLWQRGQLDLDEVPFDIVPRNVITNVGRVQIHLGAYGTTGLPSNGFNYVALSNDALTETAASTTLSSEIASNGLTRAQGTVTLPTGAGTQTTVQKVFTASGSQSAQKGALFDASSSGDMNHALAFTQRALITSDQLDITFTLTIS